MYIDSWILGAFDDYRLCHSCVFRQYPCLIYIYPEPLQELNCLFAEGHYCEFETHTTSAYVDWMILPRTSIREAIQITDHSKYNNK